MKSKPELQSIIKYGFAFVGVILLVELVFGNLAEYIYFSQKSGKQARLIESVERENNGVVILGSSHANRHYVPSAIEEILDVDVYNAGVQGQKVLFASALLPIILEKSSPKLIILNIDEGWMEESPESYDRLADLYPFYWEYRSVLKPTVERNLDYPDVQLLSAGYRLNSTILHSIIYRVKPQKAERGYRPLTGEMDEKKHLERTSRTDTPLESTPLIDSVFVDALERIIQLCGKKDIPLVAAISPRIELPDTTPTESLSMIQEILGANDVLLLDHRRDTALVGQYNLFKDASHLNHEGAKKYSAAIAQEVKGFIN